MRKEYSNSGYIVQVPADQATKPQLSDMISDWVASDACQIDPSWAQGRTVFGGVSAMLTYASAQKLTSVDMVMRDFHIQFLAPASLNITSNAQILRTGRAAQFIESKIIRDDASLATVAQFTFCADRTAGPDWKPQSAPIFPTAQECDTILFAGIPVPSFTQHYDIRLASGPMPTANSMERANAYWVRSKNWPGDDLAGLLALADAKPPLALTGVSQMVPASTISWSGQIHKSQFNNPLDWWLMTTQGLGCQDGYSTEQTRVFAPGGDLAMTAVQTVAIF